MVNGNILWLGCAGALGYWLCRELTNLLLDALTPQLGLVDALLWAQLVQLLLLISLAVGLLLLSRRQQALHALVAVLILPVAVVVSWSGTLSLYRAELDLALTPALAPVRNMEVQSEQPVAMAQQLKLALQWQQQQAPTAAQLFVEFASARKPYLTIHLQQPDRWTLTRHWLQLPTDPAKASLTALGEPTELQPGDSRHSIGGLFFSLHYQLAGVLNRAAQPLLTGLALAMLALSISGCYLCWQRYRSARVMAVFGRGPLRWHLIAGLLSVPWLWWYFGSALLTQYGSWAPALSQPQSTAYYQALFPQPASGVRLGVIAATDTELQQLLHKPGWPVGKVQLDLRSGRWLLTEQAGWPQQAPYQLRQQSLLQPAEKAPIQQLAQADYWPSQPWSLRNLGYAAHQSLYAGPFLRAGLALCGLVLVLMLCGGAESYGRKQRWWGLALMRVLTSGFVLATLLLMSLQMCSLPPAAMALLPQLILSWGCCSLLLISWTYRQYRLQH